MKRKANKDTKEENRLPSSDAASQQNLKGTDFGWIFLEEWESLCAGDLLFPTPGTVLFDVV